MREILGKAKTVRELLKGVKYSIDYYQREYKWQDKQIRELVDDLSAKFLEEYQPDHEPREGRRLSPLLPRLDHHQQEGQHQLHRGRPAAPDQPHTAPHPICGTCSKTVQTRSTSTN